MGGVNLYGFVGNNALSNFDILGNDFAGTCCDFLKTQVSIPLIPARLLILVQNQELKASIKDMRLRIAESQLINYYLEQGEIEKKKLDSKDGPSCNGCTIIKIGIQMSNPAGRQLTLFGWQYYKAWGLYTNILWHNGWYVPKPCKDVIPNVDYQTSIFDTTYINETQIKKDM